MEVTFIQYFSRPLKYFILREINDHSKNLKIKLKIKLNILHKKYICETRAKPQAALKIVITNNSLTIFVSNSFNELFLNAARPKG